MVAGHLREVSRVSQVRFEPKRRWFSAQGMDLIVWVDESNRPFSFQLCYEKGAREFALTWEVEKGFDHSFVDSGEQKPTRNNSPILRPGGALDSVYVSKLFEEASANVPTAVRDLVSEALRSYPNSPTTPGRRPPPTYRGAISKLASLITWQSLFWTAVLILSIAAILTELMRVLEG